MPTGQMSSTLIGVSSDWLTRHRRGVGLMPYARPHVRQALAAAREAGKPVDGMKSDDRETSIALERWGFLPIDQDAMDKRITDWYVSQGLAMRADDPMPDTPDTPDTPDDAPERSRMALDAAEAALAAASAALRLARMSA